MTLARPTLTAAPGLMPGILLCAGLAGTAFALRQMPGVGVLSPLILAILLGVLLRNTLGVPAAALPGMQFSLRRLLRLGIVVLGLQLTLGQMAEVGIAGLATVTAGLAATFVFTLWAGRLLGVEPGLTRLIATGTSVCGASAVLAAHAVEGGRDEDVAYAIACVTLFGTAAMILFPVLGHGLSPRAYGIWTGASIHEVAQVVAAGAQGGPEATAFATIAKLTRVALLAPLILILVRQRRAAGQGAAGRAPFPGFVLGFLAMVALASSGWVPETVTGAAAPLAQGLLAMGLAAMGLQTDIGRLRLRGLRPLALGAVSSVFIATFTLALVFALGGV